MNKNDKNIMSEGKIDENHQNQTFGNEELNNQVSECQENKISKGGENKFEKLERNEDKLYHFSQNFSHIDTLARHYF